MTTARRRPIHSAPYSAEQYDTFCRIKRFLERWGADRTFRERLAREPRECAAAYGFDLDPEELRLLWDIDARLALLRDGVIEERLPEVVQGYRRFIRERLHWRDGVRNACAPTDANWGIWRQRQIARATNELGGAWSKPIIFGPGALELSKGCSVGCWFCGVASPRLSDHFRHTPANARLFRGVLEVMVELAGPEAASALFLYWASDPLDNPDYEKFCVDFHAVVGDYPLFTTALSLKDPERTRRLLRLVEQTGTSVNRFSILTLKMLDRVHREFTPEELGRVELVLLNPESVVEKSNSGRFRERAAADPKLLAFEQRKVPHHEELLANWEGYLGPSTIACISGPLFNLVERSVKLVTPCAASDRWPLGYVVFEEGTFRSAADLRRLLRGMIERRMPTELRGDSRIRLRSDLCHEVAPAGFRAWTPYGGLEIGGRGREAQLRDLAEMIVAGTSSAGEIAARLVERHAVFPDETLGILDRLFAAGLLDEAPEAAPSDLPWLASQPEAQPATPQIVT